MVSISFWFGAPGVSFENWIATCSQRFCEPLIKGSSRIVAFAPSLFEITRQRSFALKRSSRIFVSCSWSRIIRTFAKSRRSIPGALVFWASMSSFSAARRNNSGASANPPRLLIVQKPAADLHKEAIKAGCLKPTVTSVGCRESPFKARQAESQLHEPTYARKWKQCCSNLPQRLAEFSLTSVHLFD